MSVLSGVQTGAVAGGGGADLWLLPGGNPVQHADAAHSGRHEPQVYYCCVWSNIYELIINITITLSINPMALSIVKLFSLATHGVIVSRVSTHHVC